MKFEVGERVPKGFIKAVIGVDKLTSFVFGDVPLEE
jgi:hypothetical protein